MADARSEVSSGDGRRRIGRIVWTLVSIAIWWWALPVGTASAETWLYEVDTVEYQMFMRPHLRSTTGQRIEITDHGPQPNPQETPRWESERFFVWDVPSSGGWADNMELFGKDCTELSGFFGNPVGRVVQDAHGGGDFAWLPGQNPLDGSINPYAFFCLKGSHQSTTTWSEWVWVGRRIYQDAGPIVTITRPAPSQLVWATTRIEVTTTGFTAGSRNYTLLVDGIQRQFGTTSVSSFTLWFNTTRVTNGTHVFTIRLTEGGVTVRDDVAVIVRN